MRYPCGYRNDPRRKCNCSIPQVERYMSKISGPLIDRIDLQIEVPAVPFKELTASQAGLSSADIRTAVDAARKIQTRRFGAVSKLRCNARMATRHQRDFCKLDADSTTLLRACMTEFGMSARAHDKIIRVARTIADLEASRDIQVQHVGEAINYRLLDRQLWK
jgi:magnesium chelatase family protein